MVWFFLGDVPFIGTERCGNLLADIANGKEPCCNSGSNISLFDPKLDSPNPYNYNYSSLSLTNPFDFNNQTDTSNYLNYLMLGAAANDMDLVSSTSTSWSSERTLANLALLQGLCATTPTYTTAENYADQSQRADFGELVTQRWDNVKNGVRNTPIKVSNLSTSLANYADSFVGRINSDRVGNAVFSGGSPRAWCADFVTYCVKRVYGKQAPSWFNASRVYVLKEQARLNNAYIELPNSGKSDFIANNIKPGDVMIQLNSDRPNSSGHTGIVKEVHSDGSFVVVEGNSGRVGGGQVREVRYRASNPILKGFIRI